MTTSKPQKTRLIELDACRGIAALGVVIFHYTVRYGELYGHPISPGLNMPNGHLWVAFFFMISGFVIELTLERTNKAKDFVVARFARLFPTYWACMLLTMVAVSFLGLPNREVSWATWLLNLTMLNGYALIPYVDGVYWSLRVELSFYIIAFFTYFILRKKCMTLILFTWLLMHVIYEYAPNLSSSIYFQGAVHIGAIKYSDLFIAGIVYLKVFRKEAKLIHITLLLLSLAFRISISSAGESLAILSFNAIFLLIAFNIARPLRIKPLIWLGSISYPLYLIHQNIGFAIMRHLYTHGVPTWVGIILTTVIAVITSWLIHRAVEEPSRRWIRDAYKQWSLGKLEEGRQISYFSSLVRTRWKLTRLDAVLTATLLLVVFSLIALNYNPISLKPKCDAENHAILIGDSISIHYADRVAMSAPEGWCITHAGVNAQTAKNTLDNFDAMTYGKRWDIIVLNTGLWDAENFAPEQAAYYETTVSKLMRKARSTADHVIWVQTTPVVEGWQYKRENSDILTINQIAKELADHHSLIWIETHDLFAGDIDHQLHYHDGVHLSDQGSRLIAQRITASISSIGQSIDERPVPEN